MGFVQTHWCQLSVFTLISAQIFDDFDQPAISGVVDPQISLWKNDDSLVTLDEYGVNWGLYLADLLVYRSLFHLWQTSFIKDHLSDFDFFLGVNVAGLHAISCSVCHVVIVDHFFAKENEAAFWENHDTSDVLLPNLALLKGLNYFLRFVVVYFYCVYLIYTSYIECIPQKLCCDDRIVNHL